MLTQVSEDSSVADEIVCVRRGYIDTFKVTHLNMKRYPTVTMLMESCRAGTLNADADFTAIRDKKTGEIVAKLALNQSGAPSTVEVWSELAV